MSALKAQLEATSGIARHLQEGKKELDKETAELQLRIHEGATSRKMEDLEINTLQDELIKQKDVNADLSKENERLHNKCSGMRVKRDTNLRATAANYDRRRIEEHLQQLRSDLESTNAHLKSVNVTRESMDSEMVALSGALE